MQAQQPCESVLAAATSETCPQCHQAPHTCMQVDDRGAFPPGCNALFATPNRQTHAFGARDWWQGHSTLPVSFRSRFGLVLVSFCLCLPAAHFLAMALSTPAQVDNVSGFQA